MTEEEAKTKWCPHVVASHTDPRMGFHDGDPAKPLHTCIGSACMAWRWALGQNFKQPDTNGYCGLAGQP